MSLDALTNIFNSVKTTVTDETCKVVFNECKELMFDMVSQQPMSFLQQKKAEFCETAIKQCASFWIKHYGPVAIVTVIASAALACSCIAVGCCALNCIGSCLASCCENERPRRAAP